MGEEDEIWTRKTVFSLAGVALVFVRNMASFFSVLVYSLHLDRGIYIALDFQLNLIQRDPS